MMYRRSRCRLRCWCSQRFWWLSHALNDRAMESAPLLYPNWIHVGKLIPSKPPLGHTQNLFSCKCPRTCPMKPRPREDSRHFRDCGGISWWFVHTTNLGCSFNRVILGVTDVPRSSWILGQPRRIPKNLGQPKATSPFESCDGRVQDRWRSVRVSQQRWLEHLVNLAVFAKRFWIRLQSFFDLSNSIGFWRKMTHDQCRGWVCHFFFSTQNGCLVRQQKAPALPGLVAGPCASKVGWVGSVFEFWTKNLRSVEVSLPMSPGPLDASKACLKVGIYLIRMMKLQFWPWIYRPWISSTFGRPVVFCRQFWYDPVGQRKAAAEPIQLWPPTPESTPPCTPRVWPAPNSATNGPHFCAFPGEVWVFEVEVEVGNLTMGFPSPPILISLKLQEHGR